MKWDRFQKNMVTTKNIRLGQINENSFKRNSNKIVDLMK